MVDTRRFGMSHSEDFAREEESQVTYDGEPIPEASIIFHDVQWVLHAQKTYMDKDYPHICYECKKELRWLEFLEQKPIEQELKIRIWKSPYVQLYCCSCFKKMEIIKKKEDRLIKKANRICEKFGYDLG